MNISILMNRGVRKILKVAGRYYGRSAKGRALLSHILPRIRTCSHIRRDYEKSGTHIPLFLIASVASQCNLHCTGCYARANGACGSELSQADLTAEQWKTIFEEAAALGIPFVLLAGGEPFMRKDVIQVASRIQDIVFPVFTNGTMIDGAYLSLLDQSRNIIPVFSIEGEGRETDERRGEGVSQTVYEAMGRLQDKEILFGASITVSKENLSTVTSTSFVAKLRDMGCGLLFFVEYVPVSEGSESLLLGQPDLDVLAHAVSEFQNKIDDMIILSFPGDEAAMGGCLASGRGFFHINPSGGAEPCPFSPYAQYNLKSCTILDVLKSQYFADLRAIAGNADTHMGGCTLFQHRDEVLALHIQQSRST